MNKTSWTFHEWIMFFEYLKEHTVSETFLEEVTQKGLDYQNGLQSKLITPLYDCVNHMVRRSVKEFERELNSIIEFGEMEFLELVFQKLCTELHKCLFFEKMEIFPSEIRKHLAMSVQDSIENNWKMQLEHSVYEVILENGDSSLEDIIYLLKKVRMF